MTRAEESGRSVRSVRSATTGEVRIKTALRTSTWTTWGQRPVMSVMASVQGITGDATSIAVEVGQGKDVIIAGTIRAESELDSEIMIVR